MKGYLWFLFIKYFSYNICVYNVLMNIKVFGYVVMGCGIGDIKLNG